ncbi:MAG: leucine-rich repeat protein [Lachnospiraceae bacterium]|nr:leucine-rich repeat protein [Lachnospiraceae bacterium]
MMKLMKRRAAYALALLLGVTSAFGSATVSLPEMRTAHAADAITVSSVDELKNALSKGGNIKLTKDINSVSCDVTKAVTLDLNGHTIGGVSSNITLWIYNGGSLKLINSESSGTITGPLEVGGYRDGKTLSTGALTLDSNNITINCTAGGGQAAVIVGKGSAFKMGNGKISSSNCVGVNIWGGSFTMTGGTITGHSGTSQGAGGGVVVDSNYGGTFTLAGGTITGCTAKYGGGVYVGKGSFTIESGKITNNKASVSGGGIYVKTGATYTNNATGVFSGNTAGDSSTNDVGRGSGPSSSSSKSSSSSSTRSSSSSSSSDDDDDDDSKSFSDGGTKTKGSGSSKADYKKSSSTSVKYVASEVSYSAKTATVPATVKVGGKTYNVTSISAGAFSGYSNIQSLTIGKNIKKIGKGAFDGCTKLKTLTLNSKNLTAKNIKGAFTGASVKTVYVPASKVSAYKKILTKKVTGNKNKISVKAKPAKNKK